MTIRILYFASLRETLGISSESLEPQATIKTVADLRQHLASRHPVLLTTKNLRTAVNQQMCAFDAPLVDGDEVAFFPPVTGG